MHQLQENDFSFFPINRALGLEQASDDAVGERLGSIESKVSAALCVCVCLYVYV